jgi:hypothetical protein
MNRPESPPVWIGDALEWYATPKKERIPATAKEMAAKCGVTRQDFWYQTSKPTFVKELFKVVQSVAKKRMATVFDQLGQKAEDGDDYAQPKQARKGL